MPISYVTHILTIKYDEYDEWAPICNKPSPNNLLISLQDCRLGVKAAPPKLMLPDDLPLVILIEWDSNPTQMESARLEVLNPKGQYSYTPAWIYISLPRYICSSWPTLRHQPKSVFVIDSSAIYLYVGETILLLNVSMWTFLCNNWNFWPKGSWIHLQSWFSVLQVLYIKQLWLLVVQYESAKTSKKGHLR